MKQRSLFTRDFTLVIIGQIISLFGNAALRLALPLYLLDVTGSEALFGLVSACAFVPMVILSPVGGAVADRLPKARIMAVLDFLTCALSLSLALLLDRAPLVPLLLVGLMLLYGIQGAYQPAVNASIPLLAGEDQLVSANAAINLVSSLSALVGPVLGGILYSRFGLLSVLWASGSCFLVSAVMELFIRIPHHPQPEREGVLATLWEDTRQSTRFLFRERPELARGVGLVCAINLLLSAMLIVGLPILITRRLGLPSEWYGAAQGAMALGGLVGGVLAGVLGPRLTTGICPGLLGLCGLLTLGMAIPLALSAPVMVSYAVLLLLTGGMMVLSSLFSIVMLSYIQSGTPEALMGKVMAWVMTLAMCASPLGQAAYGVLFQFCPAWTVVLGAGMATCLLAVLAKGIFRRLEG